MLTRPIVARRLAVITILVVIWEVDLKCIALHIFRAYLLFTHSDIVPIVGIRLPHESKKHSCANERLLLLVHVRLPQT